MRGSGWRLPVSMALMAISGLSAALIVGGEAAEWAKVVAALFFLVCFGWGVYEQVRFMRRLLNEAGEE